MLATRPRATAVFVLCALGLSTAMGWVTHRALSLERAEARARILAAEQEALRLALWRMDSTLSALLAQESGRPFFHYQSFYPADRPYDLPLDMPGEPEEAQAPSPLLAGPAVSTLPSALRLYFNLWTDGRISSPQVPPPPLRERAAKHLESLGLSPHALDNARANLDELASFIDPQRIRAALADARTDAHARHPALPSDPAPRARQSGEGQYDVSTREFQARRQVAQAANITPQAQIDANESLRMQWQSAASRTDPAQADELNRPNRARHTLTTTPPAQPKPGPEVGRFEPVWIGPEDAPPQLVMVRSVRIANQELWQGLWLDWPTLRTILLRQTADLLPGGDLVPARTGASRRDRTGQLLASIPALLIPGPAPPPDTLVSAFSPARQSVAVGWIVVTLALAAIGLVLREAVLLSERRGRFVSAVTHELRTPLTTFCLYSQMLADGMVPEHDRRAYLRTLRDESARLARIVENVLDFARLGSRRRNNHSSPIPIDDLLRRALPSLSARAARAGMTVDVEPAPDLVAVADPAAVERILFNLVDNACKYAAHTQDPVIRIRAFRDRDDACIRISDQGPGIPPDEQPDLFHPFQRGRAHQSGTTPGLGLGLALARSLARELGGDLRLIPDQKPGATFELRLPLSLLKP